jgi:hypothetical protein
MAISHVDYKYAGHNAVTFRYPILHLHARCTNVDTTILTIQSKKKNILFKWETTLFSEKNIILYYS